MADGVWFNFILAAIPAGMPLLLGTLGEILTEKAGNLNLGVEGMMYMGAIFGFLGGLLYEQRRRSPCSRPLAADCSARSSTPF